MGVGFREIAEAYLTEDWPRATRLSFAYIFGNKPSKRVALLAVDGLLQKERDYLEKVLTSWRTGKLLLYAVWTDRKREFVWLTEGLDLAHTGRLVERNALPLAIYAGPETQGWLVLLRRGEPPEPLLPHTLENLPKAYGMARGRELAGLYHPPQRFMQGMIEMTMRRKLGIER